MTNLTKKAKIALAGGGAGLLALAVAMGIWQPWNKPAGQTDDPNQQQQQEQTPEPEKEGLTLTVGGEKIPCTLYEGDGWSIYVPEGWTVDAWDNGGIFTAPAENTDRAPRVEVVRGDYAAYIGSYVSMRPEALSPTEEWRLRSFCTGDLDGTWEVTCQASKEEWGTYQKLMTAMAHTFTVGGEKPFSGLSPVASEPDWQIAEGNTILWMDKDGYVVDDAAKAFVEAGMLAWDREKKACFTGKYRMEDLTWAASYTCLPGKEYVDAFHCGVWYEIAPGAEENLLLSDNMRIQDGWLYEGFALNAVVFHDGSAVEETRVFYSNLNTPGGSFYLSDLMRDDPDSASALTAEELKQCEDWFNDKENNGLLRFAYETNTGVGDYLSALFYDLGETGDKLTEAEKTALEKAGVSLELDVTKLTREYVLNYLREKLAFANAAEELLDHASDLPGTYLAEYSAWYQSHGDTAMQTYAFDRGEFYPSGGGYVKLYYTAPFLWDENGGGAFDVPMVVTLEPYVEEAGKWCVVSNVPVK